MLKVGDKVTLDMQFRGTVACTSGTDQTCIIRYGPDGMFTTPWLPMDSPRIVQD